MTEGIGDHDRPLVGIDDPTPPGRRSRPTRLTSTSANRTIPLARPRAPAGARLLAGERSRAGRWPSRYAQAATRRMPSMTIDADVDRHDRRGIGVAELEPCGTATIPTTVAERRRERHDQQSIQAPADPRTGGPARARRAMIGETRGPRPQRQAVVQLGHRDRRTGLVGSAASAPRRRASGVARISRSLDEREQDRAEEQDRASARRVRVADEERGREAGRGDRGKTWSP